MAVIEETTQFFEIRGDLTQFFTALFSKILEMKVEADLELRFSSSELPRGKLTIRNMTYTKLLKCPLTENFIAPSQAVKDIILVSSPEMQICADSFHVCARVILSDCNIYMKQRAGTFMVNHFDTCKFGLKDVHLVVNQLLKSADNLDPSVTQPVMKFVFFVARDPECMEVNLTPTSIFTIFQCIVGHETLDTKLSAVMAITNFAKRTEQNRLAIGEYYFLQVLLNILGDVNLGKAASMAIHELCRLNFNKQRALHCNVAEALKNEAIPLQVKLFDPHYPTALLLLLRTDEGARRMMLIGYGSFRCFMEALQLESSMPVWDLCIQAIEKLWESYRLTGKKLTLRTTDMRRLVKRIIRNGTEQVKAEALLLCSRLN